MKLLVTYFIPSGGVETVNRLRYHALRAVGIEVHALYLWNGAGVQNMAGIPHFITNDDFEIIRILQTNNYDAIICICDHLMMQRLRGLGYRGTIIYEAQGLGTREQAESTLSHASMFIRQYAQAAVCSPAPHLMTLFQRYLGDFPRFYVQNMIDTAHFNHVPGTGLNPNGARILGWIGRLEANKNFPLFLQIAAELVADHPHLVLWMFEDATISEPGEREKFVRLVEQLGLSQRLVVRSNVPHNQMPRYLSAIADSGGLLLSTSNTEGFGYAVAEAMGCLCPVLSTDSDGVRGLLDNGRTGTFFPGSSVKSGVQAARHLLRDRQGTAAIAQAARQHVSANFSLGRYAADTINVLAALHLHLR